MHHHNDRDEALTIRRIEQTLASIRGRYLLESVPLTAKVWKSQERLPFSRRKEGEGQFIVEGEKWGRDWSSAWFYLTGEVPRSWEGAFVVGWFVIDGEGLIYDGSGRAIQGISGGSVYDITASRTTLDLLNPAQGGEKIELWMEAGAHGYLGITPVDCWTGGEGERPTGLYRYGTFVAKVHRMRLARVDRLAWELRWDFEVLFDLLKGLPKGSVRRARLLKALEDVATILGRGGSMQEARARLAPELAKPACASDIMVRAVGHAHIDTAWLWSMAETQRKIACTFANQLRLIEHDPEYVFGASAAQHYAWIKESHPDLYGKIQEAVKRGRWELQGGMWVECDCNIPSGESIVRQILHGKNFFQDEFGIEVDILWLPDVFGYAASLPQILVQAGIHAFLTQKLSWNQYNTFPYHTFWWKGIDGSQVLAHFPPENTYNSELKPHELMAAQERFSEKAFATEMMSLFGIGDGGGGPREEMLERAKRMANLEGCPPVRLGSAREFFQSLRRISDQLPTWTGELYLELHRGTLTTQAKVKQANRRLERRLYELEMLWTLRLEEYPMADFDAIWKEMLTLQFHDILPGSSIRKVYQEAHASYDRLLQKCDALQERFAETLSPTDGVTFWNSLAIPYQGVVPLPLDFGPYQVMIDGKPVPTQLEEGRTVAFLLIPPQSFVTATRGPRLGSSPQAGLNPPLETPRSSLASRSSSEIFVLDNGLAQFVLDRGGRVLEARVKGVEGNLLRAPGNVISLYNDRPLAWDAWDIDRFYREEKLEEAVFTVEDLGAGPVRHRLRLYAQVGHSTITQIVSLASGSARLDFHTTVDWRETHRMLRVAFPAAIHTHHASCEIQYGYVRRPTYENTLWEKAQFEVAAHRWVDLSEPTRGLALLNDGKYGHSVQENILDLALLRAPTSPDPDADQGLHTFTYSLLPHAGDLVASPVVEEAARLNQPPMPIPGRVAPSSPLSATVIGKGVELVAYKRAEKREEVVLRLVEILGRRTRATVQLSKPGRLVSCDLLEWREGEETAVASVHSLEFKPFEIRTFFVRF